MAAASTIRAFTRPAFAAFDAGAASAAFALGSSTNSRRSPFGQEAVPDDLAPIGDVLGLAEHEVRRVDERGQVVRNALVPDDRREVVALAVLGRPLPSGSMWSRSRSTTRPPPVRRRRRRHHGLRLRDRLRGRRQPAAETPQLGVLSRLVSAASCDRNRSPRSLCTARDEAAARLAMRLATVDVPVISYGYDSVGVLVSHRLGCDDVEGGSTSTKLCVAAG